MPNLPYTRPQRMTGGTPDEYQTEGSNPAMSFLDHIEELRWHLIRAGLSVCVAAIGIFVMGERVFQAVILAPKEPWFITYSLVCKISDYLCFSPPIFNLETRQLGEQFFVHLKTSILLGLVVSFPYVFYEFWRFIRPGLYVAERRAVRGIVLICTGLFYSGVAFGYFVIAPFAISFLAGYTVGAINAPTLASYVSYMAMFTLPTGLVFQLPVAIFFLARLGLITAQFMRTYRRHSFVVILVLAAIITPPDMITQLLIAVPLYGLFEVSILIAKRVEKKQALDWESDLDHK